MSRQAAVHVRVTGRVQGVGFRAWTRDQAGAIGVTGWVRNEADGAVTAMLVGPEALVAILLRKLHVGPPGAKIVEVIVEQTDAGPAGGGFHILR